MKTERYICLLAAILALFVALEQPYKGHERLMRQWVARAKLVGSVVRIGLNFDANHSELQRLWSLIELN